MWKRSTLWLKVVAATSLAFAAPEGAAGGPDRPNIVFIIVDDLRWDELGCTGHPFARTPNIDRVAAEGIRLRNAFATTPLCSPSRASILTGLYPHAHGIVDNTARDAQSHRLITFPLLLQRAGYETAYVGKWHMGNDDSRRPGFDHWVSVRGQGTSLDPELNVDGEAVRVSGHTTDVFNERAVAFLERPRAKPFALYLAHKALHPETAQNADGSLSDPGASRFIPAARHEGLYADATVPRRPNVADTLEGKPALRREIDGLPPLGPGTGTSDEAVRDRQRMLAAVDEGVGLILGALERSGTLDDTLVLIASDHGYFYGEHGLSFERRLAYEEAIRIPLIARYPPLIRAGTTSDRIVLTIDIAPTLLELGRAPALDAMHGRSFVPLLRGEDVELHATFLIEHSSDRVFPRVFQMGYTAVRTHRWKYIRYAELDGMDELYDLDADPFEMRNLIADPGSQAIRAGLQRELDRLRDEAP